ncbi:chemotaxis protein MotB [Campylobacter mucosalis]|uniref:OmpA family protein n=1 Tax=Campylobacter mucosalis TaxID=202 RepID=UPI0004D4C94F|nr:OmpA family protein [Campylobacter mucosalis]KEA46638.1 chemotaxis protein MotB [Campylobacter mucosalis]QKF62845.1 OmpA domain-containing protein [Campylobacter mucosalis]
MKFNKNHSDQTFWVSYADLMAGLLFVFMLIIGGVVVKYLLSQNELENKEKTIVRTLENLKDEQGKNLSLDKLNHILKDEIKKLDAYNLELKNKNEVIVVELEALKTRLQALSDLNYNITAQNNELNTSVSELQTKIIVLNSELNDVNSSNEKNLAQIANLLSQISDKDAKYNILAKDLNATKTHIKNLTGIRIKVISVLKEKLGDSIEIDQNSGALRLNSSVLFDRAKAELKDEAKVSLKNTLDKYFDILLNDPEISKNIDQIIIEGFTDSDGTYMRNLELSQRRAYAVMEFINSYNQDERLRRLLIASGRSYNDLIIKNGKEDKNASRRIEIKFSISNKDAIKEIEKFLEQK